jgi:glutathione S-transferase
LPPVFGLIWIVGRIIYMNGYMAAPEKRSNGFLIAGIGVVGLLIMSIVGIVMAWSAITAAV